MNLSLIKDLGGSKKYLSQNQVLSEQDNQPSSKSTNIDSVTGPQIRLGN